MELFMALEEEFEIEIADEESENLVYMKDIVNCIYTKITTS
jgi:acyl carrier protein